MKAKGFAQLGTVLILLFAHNNSPAALVSDLLMCANSNINTVPLLGDIPVIGALFRASKTTSVKRNLVVFIRATVIKDPNKARLLSYKKYNFMRDLQLRGDEPVIRPVLLPYE